MLHSPLVYAAFEYRCSIERIIIELYSLIKDLNLTDEEISTLKDTATVVKKILQVAGGSHEMIARALRFNAVFTEEMIADIVGLKKPMAEPDLRRLLKLWGKLSEYCHRQLIPDDSWDSPEWIVNGYRQLEEARVYLFEIKVESHFGYMVESSMKPEAQDLKRKFIDEAIDEAGLRESLRRIK